MTDELMQGRTDDKSGYLYRLNFCFIYFSMTHIEKTQLKGQETLVTILANQFVDFIMEQRRNLLLESGTLILTRLSSAEPPSSTR